MRGIALDSGSIYRGEVLEKILKRSFVLFFFNECPKNVISPFLLYSSLLVASISLSFQIIFYILTKLSLFFYN